MAIINTSLLRKRYGADECFSGLTFEVEPSSRIGLIGANGCGKTSLLRILAGTDTEYEGTLSVQRGLRVGFLEQNPVFPDAGTVHDAVLAAAGDLVRLEREMERVHHEMAVAGSTGMERLIKELDRLQRDFELAGGYDIEARAERIMTGVGISDAMRGQPVAELSGGERHRVALARLLLAEPDVWLLDEPTNHLDVEGIFFLEKFLAAHPAAVMLVSHDRRFLDTVTTETWEIETRRLYRYPAAYSRSRVLREERIASEQNAFSKQQDTIRKQEEYIRRFKAGQRARQAKGRQKRLERLERLEGPAAQSRAMALSFPCQYRLGTRVLSVDGLAKAYPGKALFGNMSFELEAGEVLAILGPNGAGKTSFFNICLGDDTPDAGRAAWGESARPGALRQHDRFPDESLTPLQYLQMDWATTPDQELRSILGAMLFSGEDALRPVRGFSGGECKRLMLTRLLMEGHNVLLLDEPTNHLDLQSREVLELALSAYEGSILLISHDRYFVDALADRSLWIEDGACFLTEGGFTEAWAAREARRERPTRATERKNARRAVPEEKPAQRSGPYAKVRTEQLEEKIIAAEELLKCLQARFTEPEVYASPDRVATLRAEIEAARGELVQLEEEYSARE